MADVNGDGKLDVYLCYSGKQYGDKRVHQLFINQGNDVRGIPHFAEKAAEYGLADSSYSTQAFFFDYDRDGDLDLLLLNHSISRRTTLDEPEIRKLLGQNDHVSGLKLMRNDKGHFSEVTAAAGIRSTVLSHGLGAAIADLNGDGWPDMYISNDYLEPDFLYINNQHGGFTDELQSRLGHTSFSPWGTMWPISITTDCRIFLPSICCRKTTGDKNCSSPPTITKDRHQYPLRILLPVHAEYAPPE